MARCRHVGLLLCLISFGRVMPGVIEIVEELSCSDREVRLTCRGFDTHIAVLEAWFTSVDYLPLRPELNRSASKPPIDQLLDQVHVFSSPRHNGLYAPEDPTPALSASNGTEVNGTMNATVNSVVDGTSSVVDVASSVVDGTSSVVDGTSSVVDAASSVVDALSGVDAASECEVSRFQNSYPSGHAGGSSPNGVWFSRDVSVNLRSPLSYRCTGVNHCSFLLAADHAPAAATEWGRGALYIKYACFDDAHSTRFCNREVNATSSGPASEGYLRTPGYPNYYVGEALCLWRLRAPEGQRLRLTLVDVSFRSIGPFEEKCTDHVSAWDAVAGGELLSTCDQPDLPLAVESRSHAIDVLIETRSEGAYPKRGVLMHYKSVGCVTPPAPPDGYLLYREALVARYVCGRGTVFADSRQRARALVCVDDNRWNDTLPPCIEDPASGTAAANDSSKATSSEPKLTSTDTSMIVDIVIPSLLIAALFIGNAFIVLIIYKYRKRKTDEGEDEFNTIPLSYNGGALQSVGNAV